MDSSRSPPASRFGITLLLCVLLFVGSEILVSEEGSHVRRKLLITLFSPPTEKTLGSVTRTLAIAIEAEKRGYDVAWICADSKADVLRHNLEKNKLQSRIYLVEETRMFSINSKYVSDLIRPFMNKNNKDIPENALYFLGDIQKKTIGNMYFVWCLTGYCSETFLKKLVRDYLRIYLEFRPDVIFHEFDPISYVATFVSGIPAVVSSAGLYISQINEVSSVFKWWTQKVWVNIVNDCIQRRSSGTDDRYYTEREILRSLILEYPFKVIPNIRRLENEQLFLAEKGLDFLFVGHLLPEVSLSSTRADSIEDDEYSRKMVIFSYFGIGSVDDNLILQSFPVLLEQLNEGLGDSEEKFHIYVGGSQVNRSFDTEFLHFRSFIDGNRILKSSVAFWNHAGANSITQSLLNGCPLILSPGYIFERRINANNIVRAGAGVIIEKDEIKNVTGLVEKVKSFRLDKMKKIAVELGNEIRDSGGVGEMFDHILNIQPADVSVFPDLQHVVESFSDLDELDFLTTLILVCLTHAMYFLIWKFVNRCSL